MIQAIKLLPEVVAGKNIFMVCLDKEMLFFDFNTKALLESLFFRYSKMTEKIF